MISRVTITIAQKNTYHYHNIIHKPLIQMNIPLKIILIVIVIMIDLLKQINYLNWMRLDSNNNLLIVHNYSIKSYNINQPNNNNKHNEFILKNS